MYCNYRALLVIGFNHLFIIGCGCNQVGRLHCLYPWWEDATVNFMNSGGYNVSAQIKKVLVNVS